MNTGFPCMKFHAILKPFARNFMVTAQITAENAEFVEDFLTIHMQFGHSQRSLRSLRKLSCFCYD